MTFLRWFWDVITGVTTPGPAPTSKPRDVAVVAFTDDSTANPMAYTGHCAEVNCALALDSYLALDATLACE